MGGASYLNPYPIMDAGFCDTVGRNGTYAGRAPTAPFTVGDYVNYPLNCTGKHTRAITLSSCTNRPITR